MLLSFQEDIVDEIEQEKSEIKFISELVDSQLKELTEQKSIHDAVKSVLEEQNNVSSEEKSDILGCL